MPYKKSFFIILMGTLLSYSCYNRDKKNLDFTFYSSPIDANLWLEYSKEQSKFKLWSPFAKKVKLHLYRNGHDGTRTNSYDMSPSENGVWTKNLKYDLNGTYYTYQVNINNVSSCAFS